MTVPDAAAWIGVPYETPMSIPSCIRPHRQPNGLVTGPETGQTSPADDGASTALALCGADPLGQRGARRLERVDLLRVGAILARELREVGQLLLPRAGEIVRARRRARRARRGPACVRASITAVSPWTRRTELLRLRTGGACLHLRVRRPRSAMRRSCTPMSVRYATWSSASWTVPRPRKTSSDDGGSDS